MLEVSVLTDPYGTGLLSTIFLCHTAVEVGGTVITYSKERVKFLPTYAYTTEKKQRIGTTNRSLEEIKEHARYLDEITTYSVVNNNCRHFTNALLEFINPVSPFHKEIQEIQSKFDEDDYPPYPAY